MGHYRSEMITAEEREHDRRFHEALDIQGKLADIPMSRFTFWEASFLIDFYQFRHSHNVRPDTLERLREILKRVTAEGS